MSVNSGARGRYCAATGIEALGLLAADGNAARAAFLDELEWVVDRLGSTNLELSFVIVDIAGLSTPDVIRCADALTGKAAFWRPLGDTRFIAVFLTPVHDCGLLERSLLEAMQQAARRHGHACQPPRAEVRILQRWNHDIVDGFYLLQEVAALPPLRLAAGLRSAA